MPLECDKICILQKINYHNSGVTTCDFGSNYHLATGSGDKSVCVWEWKPGLGFVDTTYSPLLSHKYTVTCVKFSPQGSLLASASIDGSTNLWNVQTGECIATFVHSGGSGVRCCCFSSRNIIATAGDDGTICLWDLVTRALIKSIECHEETIHAICFSPDSVCLASGDLSGQLKLWHVNTFTAPLSIISDAHDLGVLGLEFMQNYERSSNGKQMDLVYRLVSCGTDHLIRMWDVTVSEVLDGQEANGIIEPFRSLVGHSSAVTSVHFNPTGSLIVSSSLDKTARLWDVTSQRCLRVLEAHSRYVDCCSFSRDHSLLATGSNDKMLIIWDLTGSISIDSSLTTSDGLSNIKNKEAAVVKFAEMDGKQVKLWQRLDTNSSVSFNTCDFIFKNGEHLLAAAGSKVVHIWQKIDRFVESEMSPLEGHRYSINQLEFSSDGKLLVTCSLDGTALIWDVETGTILKSGFQVSSGGLRAVRFSPDCKLLATGGDDETLSVHRTDTCETLVMLTGHTESISCIAFTADSAYYVSGCAAGNFRVWCAVPVSSVCCALVENAHDLGVASCDFAAFNVRAPSDSEKGYLLATCGNDSLVKLWELQTVDELTVQVTNTSHLCGHGGNVTCVRFSPGLSEVIASTATDKTCRIWDAYNGDCVHVLDQHDSILTCCAFSYDATLLATGSLDKSVLIWELPKDLAFQNFVASRARTKEDKSLKMPGVSSIQASGPLDILDQSHIDCELWETNEDIPEEFTCPITHQLMRDPVICIDGYTYERSAIESWFASGRETSPMTNNPVPTTDVTPNYELQQQIDEFLKH
ncbi:WD repeat, SAM and U-box domain-containing protein 1-like isoform X2 [Lycorma delicatula]|uniref:WD repeat, SAM and U-box domain-containing protein 1-like isoform X2 n=1 Tax=Lycorma delicatula TaxID=130591 RepID=UPI003F51A62E